MIVRVEVAARPGQPDARGENLRRQVAALGIPGLRGIRVTDLYFLEGDLEVTGSRAEFELEQRLQLCAYVGTLINLGDPNASLMAEFLFTGSGWGIGIGAMVRCP